MKILFLTHYFPPEVNAPASRTFEHCKRWVEAGHEVTVITCFPNCPDGVIYPSFRNHFRKVEKTEGIRVVRVWSFIAPNSDFLKRILNFVSYMIMAVLNGLFEKNVDVMVATSPHFFCGWAGVFLKWFRGFRFVLEIRDIWPESILEVGAMKKGFAIRVLEAMERQMYRSAQHIVAVGEGYKKKIMQRGVAPEKIDVVINGVDLEKFQQTYAGTEFRKKYGLNGKFVCSYVGTVGMAHGLEVVIEAAEQLKKQGQNDVIFLVVGEGARRKTLQDLAEKKGVFEQTRFLGRLPKEQMPAIISASDANLVHLKKSELFTTVIPSKIFECMAMNTPIIMGVEGESREMVKAAGAGLSMRPSDPASLLACIEKIRDQGRKTFAARDYARKHYDRSVLADRMLDILQKRI